MEHDIVCACGVMIIEPAAYIDGDGRVACPCCCRTHAAPVVAVSVRSYNPDEDSEDTLHYSLGGGS